MFRRHLFRAFARVVVLIATDLGAFFLFREAIRAIRDRGTINADLAQWVQFGIPRGTLGGWAFALALIIGLGFAGSYGRGDARRDANRLLGGVALAAGLSLWGMIEEAGIPLFLIAFGCTVGFVWLAVLAERCFVDELVAHVFPNPHKGEQVLFVGNPSEQVAARAYRNLVGIERMVPLGWLAVNGSRRTPGILGSTDQVWDVLRQTLPDTVVLCGMLSNDVFESVVEASAAAGCRVLAVSRYEGIGSLKPGLVWHRGMPFVELTVPSLKARHLILKRVIDLLGSIAGLVMLSPLFAVIAAAIKLDSKGPVFFLQDRVGMGGRVFRFVKFRTMRDGADAEKSKVAHLNQTGDPRLFKIPNDPRVTRLGAWLRQWSLDELPQLWNVLIGDMSLVGPRPFFESDLQQYRDHHLIRLGAKPGMTGLWQVNGRSSVVDFEEVVRLDRAYIDEWSLWLDLKILVRTVPAVCSRAGAF